MSLAARAAVDALHLAIVGSDQFQFAIAFRADKPVPRFEARLKISVTAAVVLNHCRSLHVPVLAEGARVVNVEVGVLTGWACRNRIQPILLKNIICIEIVE